MWVASDKIYKGKKHIFRQFIQTNKRPWRSVKKYFNLEHPRSPLTSRLSHLQTPRHCSCSLPQMAEFSHFFDTGMVRDRDPDSCLDKEPGNEYIQLKKNFKFSVESYSGLLSFVTLRDVISAEHSCHPLDQSKSETNTNRVASWNCWDAWKRFFSSFSTVDIFLNLKGFLYGNR